MKKIKSMKCFFKGMKTLFLGMKTIHRYEKKFKMNFFFKGTRFF